MKILSTAKRMAILVQEHGEDLRNWWLFTCRDCRRNYGSHEGLRNHIIARDFCTIDPVI